ncbi:hypothetical protein F4820DRAFT_465854 [Hypoxylon rubiginosum]|uniref:Uncharacterized protein n=1 Tax=Hypoxylon rubiginosum TaxID=110542 RepID=A0ACB9ZAN2_9PEZI|nr:hypothetical protein F4820DRAFT_465854 [Hypoxylon rubiginosum]
MATSPQSDSNVIEQEPNFHWFDTSYDYLPMFTRVQCTLDEVRTYKWWPSNVFNPPEQEVINIFLKRLDKLLHECEVSRQQKETWERFKADEDKMRRDFVSRGDGKILLTLAQLAQDRARIINYVLAHRVSPVIHQNYIDTMFDKNVPCESAMIDEQHIREMAGEIIELFWGDERGQNPLPQPWLGDDPSISNYRGWADRIDDKLAAMPMTMRSDKNNERLIKLFWWDGEPQPSRRPKLPDGSGDDISRYKRHR